MMSAHVPETAGGVEGSAFGGVLDGITPAEALSMLHLPLFVLLIGLVLWHLLLRGRTEEEAGRHRTWTLNVLRLQLVLAIGATTAAVAETVGLDDLVQVRDMLLDTAPGIGMTALILLSAVGLFLLQRSRLFDFIWLLAAVAAKTQTGPAPASDDCLLASFLSGVHLIGAGLWAGGLLLLALMWRRYRFDAERLLPAVSGGSLAAFVLLATSGLFSSMIYLPDLSYLRETRWGTLFLIKLALVAAVILFGAWIRRRHREGNIRRVGGLIKIDFTLMLFIAGLAALLSASEPVPDNEPLHWHEMGAEVHMTAEIAPKDPGDNVFAVTVWLAEGSGRPESVAMNIYPGKTGGEARSIPLRQADDLRSEYGFPGFDEYHYAAESDQLDARGWWRIEVIVTGPDGHDWRFERTVRVY